MKNVAYLRERTDAEVFGKFGRFIFLECHCLTREAYAILFLNSRSLFGPLGDLWNGQHLLLKKFASTAKSTLTQAPNCSPSRSPAIFTWLSIAQ